MGKDNFGTSKNLLDMTSQSPTSHFCSHFVCNILNSAQVECESQDFCMGKEDFEFHKIFYISREKVSLCLGIPRHKKLPDNTIHKIL